MDNCAKSTANYGQQQITTIKMIKIKWIKYLPICKMVYTIICTAEIQQDKVNKSTLPGHDVSQWRHEQGRWRQHGPQ